MDEGPPRERSSLMKGAKDIAREVKRQAIKKVGRGVDRVQDEHSGRSYFRFEEDEDDDMYARQSSFADETDDGPNDDASSDATEGHDEEDEIYEGEYQGIPHQNSGKANHLPVAGGVSGDIGGQYADAVERQSDQEQMAQQYELTLEECGHGRFQWELFIVLGLALMADGVEIFVVGFVLPSAEKDLCITDSSKGWLGCLVYLGMMLGSFVFGGLGDKLGRRQSLLICLCINGLFAFLSSFVQGYGSFLFCRLLSGIGIGGVIPIVYAYYAEFLAYSKRGEHLSWICMFWMIGGIFASAMAWAIIPHYGWSFRMGSEYQFHSWRVFVIVCALPAVMAIVALTFIPESPRFLLENGKHDEAWMILKRVHDTNMKARGHPEKVFTVTSIKTPKQMDEFIEIQTDTGTWYKRWFVRFATEVGRIWVTFKECFSPPLKRNTFKLMSVWASLAFSFYGLTVWFPEVIKRLQEQDYHRRTKVFDKEHVEGFTFNFTLENMLHRDGEYINDKFLGMKFKSVIFENSLFKDCFFEDVTSTNTFFKNCTFDETTFYNTDLFQYKFINSYFLNSTFLYYKKGCHIDFSEDYSAYWVYFVSFLGSLAVLPGNIVSALLMDKLGRIKMTGGSLILSGISCFFLWFGNSEATMIGLLCLFNGLSISAWNALSVISVEMYPTNKRTTAFGFLNAVSRLAAVFGNIIFDASVDVSKTIAVLLASSVLVGNVNLRTSYVLSLLEFVYTT
uniref:Major facilitator superfamily (MFS) profile domain-containing protein n=1 Tax=Eptatretus burgeri TaxID=7764 RepID=A0A8C4NBM5_EPTBU